jgi:DNA invertase Pin-like site-specific DNA recombinase
METSQTKTQEKPTAYSYIRFSSAEQSLGDSKRRQVEKTIEYCNQNNLNLSNDTFYDEGISGFRGKNKIIGELARFLNLCKSNKIKNGSYLLCEHIDRISREKLWDAFGTVQKILNEGIVLVTLNDGKKYSKQVLNQTDMITLMFSMFQSNEESSKKQERIQAVWKNKRNQIKNGKIVKLSQIPHWLEKSKTGEIIKNEAKSNTIIMIFDMFVNQKIGTNGIHKILNKDNVPLISNKKKSKQWHKSYIVKILKNKSVTGYTHFYTVNENEETNKKQRTLVPESLVEIYPRLISDEMFEEAQIKLKDSTRYNKGRIGLVNVFSPQILRCARCNNGMIIVSKAKNEKWVKCKSYNDGLGCDNSFGYPYDEMEKSFFSNVKEIDFSKAFDDNNFNSEISNLNIKIERVTTQIINCEQKISNLLDSISMLNGRSKDIAIKKVNENENEIETYKKEIIDLRIKKENIESTVRQPLSLQKLILSLDDEDKNKSEIKRLQIKQLIHEQVDYIKVYTYRIKSDFGRFTDKSWLSFLKKCRIKINQERFKKLRAYRIKFKFINETRLVRGIPKYYSNESVLTKTKI